MWALRPPQSSSRALKPLARPVARLRPSAQLAFPRLSRRGLLTTPPRNARYERFDTPSTPGPSGGRPDVLGYLRRRAGGDRALWVYGIGIGGGGVYYVYHLERVEDTGRLRFMDCDESTETAMGLETQQATLQQYATHVLPPNHPTTKRVRAVATRIIESSGLGRVKTGNEMGAVEAAVDWRGGAGADVQDALFGSLGKKAEQEGWGKKQTEWEVYVIDDPKTKNAFVVPGGKIFVFTGILPVSANDNGLATVMGHEIAHQVARHSAERLSSMKVLFGLSFLLESLGLDVGMTRLLLTFLYQLPNSRTNEKEADYIGLKLMAKACFDPTESPKMWERMAASEGGGGSVDFISTHPASTKRIKNLQEWLPEAMQVRAASPCGSTASHFGAFQDAVGHGMGRTLWG
ncbi:metalloendopeptidase [Cryptotrichosporon argae]